MVSKFSLSPYLYPVLTKLSNNKPIAHHRDEESKIFPKIEDTVGEKGILDVNVDQHRAFEGGLEAYQHYLTDLAGKEDEFSGKRLLKLIDDFAPALQTHLSDEIPTLLALRKYGSKLPLLEILSSARGDSSLAKTGPIMFFFHNLDLTFEDGLWSNWPPIPRPVRWGLVRVFGWFRSPLWKFASCDCNGQPQKLYAVK
jgi:hypothetical protein